jgi:hypothetical protein
VLHCIVIAALAGTVLSANPGVGLAIGFFYALSTAFAGLVVFVPVLLLLKGLTFRYALIFGPAGFLAGFIPTLLLFGMIAALDGTDPRQAFAGAAIFGLFNGGIGLFAGLLTRYWLRNTLLRGRNDHDALMRIYA